MTILITGVAGFIGSNLARKFLGRGDTVLGVDNLARGRKENLRLVLENPKFHFLEVDICDYEPFLLQVRKVHETHSINEVWHMAANSDIPAGIQNAEIDLKDTFMTTFYTLQVMKALKIKTIAFASSSAVYGNLGNEKLVENIGPLFPISNYGAMKLASEAAISASVESDLEKAFIFRFPNVIGVPATHGVILDFINKLQRTPDNLDVLGDGTQQKAYLHVDELIEAMIIIRDKGCQPINYFNIGANDEGATVRSIAEEVVKQVSPKAKISFGVGNKGWVGDVPQFTYSIDKLLNLGWRPKLNSTEAVKKAVGQILEELSQ